MSKGYFVVRAGATALRNDVIFDADISLQALGVLARALAAPPGADLGYRAFLGRGMGEKAVRGALRELEDAGYRHRFTVQRKGRIATVTVFSDVPIDSHEAQEAVRFGSHDIVVDCPTDPERFRRSDRADTGAARSDQAKQGVSADRAVQRSTAARQGAALPRRGINDSSLRSESNGFQTEPRETDEGVSRSGAVRKPDSSEADDHGAPHGAAVVAECLPRWLFERIEPAGLGRVIDALRVRLAAGWTPSQIRNAVDGNVPKQIGLGSSFALFRLDRNVIPDLAPARQRQLARESARIRTEARLAASVQDDGADSPGEPDPRKDEIEAALRAEHPDWSETRALLEATRIRIREKSLEAS